MLLSACSIKGIQQVPRENIEERTPATSPFSLSVVPSLGSNLKGIETQCKYYDLNQIKPRTQKDIRSSSPVVMIARNKYFVTFLEFGVSSDINLDEINKIQHNLETNFLKLLDYQNRIFGNLFSWWTPQVEKKLFPIAIILRNGKNYDYLATGQNLSLNCDDLNGKPISLRDISTISVGSNALPELYEDFNNLLVHELGHLFQNVLGIHPMSPWSEAFADFFAQSARNFDGVYGPKRGLIRKVVKRAKLHDYNPAKIQSDLRSLPKSLRDFASKAVQEEQQNSPTSTVTDKKIIQIELQAISDSQRDFRLRRTFDEIYQYPQPHWISVVVNHLNYSLSKVLTPKILIKTFVDTLQENQNLTLNIDFSMLSQKYKRNLIKNSPKNRDIIEQIFSDLKWNDTFISVQAGSMVKDISYQQNGVTISLSAVDTSKVDLATHLPFMVYSLKYQGNVVAYLGSEGLGTEYDSFHLRPRNVCLPDYETYCFCSQSHSLKLELEGIYRNSKSQVSKLTSEPIDINSGGEIRCWAL